MNVPPGASGSSTIKASDRADCGKPLKDSAGEMFSPLHVYFVGIGAPGAKAALRISIFGCAQAVAASGIAAATQSIKKNSTRGLRYFIIGASHQVSVL